MRTLIVSYSRTGNNKDLARGLAATLPAEHVEVTESKARTTGTIALDILFGRTPKVAVPHVNAEQYDLLVFVGPVWMGHVATPLRACFKALGSRIRAYAWVSISGGADGPNPKLGGELTKRLGREPVAVIDMHIADLLPPEPKATRDVTMAYRVSVAETERITERAAAELRHTMVGGE